MDLLCYTVPSPAAVEGSNTLFPILSFLIVHNTLSPGFEAMVGSAGCGSAFPWDANSFTMSLQFLPTVFPMCLEDQGKHSRDEWLTEKESERLWSSFSTTSPGRIILEVLAACRARDNAGRISQCDCLRRAWASQRCHTQITDLNRFWGGDALQCATYLLLG